MKFLVAAFFLLLIVANAIPTFSNLTTSPDVYWVSQKGLLGKETALEGKIDGKNHVVKGTVAVSNLSLPPQIV